jgi:hypothetical protein
MRELLSLVKLCKQANAISSENQANQFYMVKLRFPKNLNSFSGDFKRFIPKCFNQSKQKNPSNEIKIWISDYVKK